MKQTKTNIIGPHLYAESIKAELPEIKIEWWFPGAGVRGNGEMGKWGNGDQRYKLLVIISGDLPHSLVMIVNFIAYWRVAKKVDLTCSQDKEKW